MLKQARDLLAGPGPGSRSELQCRNGFPSPPQFGVLARKPIWNLLAGVFLFFATAGFVLWQNSHVGVLWDLSCILENSTRISLGQLPYRDFPFPFAPLTFVVQAAIIKLFGRAIIHHYLYAAAAAGCATLLSWRILLRQLAHSALPPRLTALLLSVPLIFLGTGSIFPYPFYDPDCTLAILFCLWLLLRLESREWPPRSTFFCGSLLVLPIFVKQNTGLAFLLAAAVGIGWLWLKWRKMPDGAPDACALLLAGAATGLACALILIHLTCGLQNYYHWTMQFAAARRLPGLSTTLGFYWDPALLWKFVAFASGLAIVRVASVMPTARSTGAAHAVNPLKSAFGTSFTWPHAAGWIGCALLSLPFLWTVAALAFEDNDSDRAEALLHLWPVLLAASLLFALAQFPRAKSIAQILPVLVLAAIHGAFLSQQLWGSTYAIWPLLMILVATILVALAPRSSSAGRGRSGVSAAPVFAFAAIVSFTLLIAGGRYALSHERLSYADLSGDRLEHSTLAPLRGLAARGDWLPEFEELVSYADREIPRGDAILTIHGEDLFYFTTGRTPRFPVIMMDKTMNPYSAEQIAQLAQRSVAWVIVKRKMQLQDEPLAFYPELITLLGRDFEIVERLENYDIFHRKGVPRKPAVGLLGRKQH